VVGKQLIVPVGGVSKVENKLNVLAYSFWGVRMLEDPMEESKSENKRRPKLIASTGRWPVAQLMKVGRITTTRMQRRLRKFPIEIHTSAHLDNPPFE
jgi:hypothetical protein